MSACAHAPATILRGSVPASSHHRNYHRVRLCHVSAFGSGFLESVYRRALVVEFRRRGVRVEQEVAYELFHHGEPVGYYKADLVVESQVIVETKTGLTLDPLGRIQLLNYLSAARLTLGLLIHFGPTGARVKRIVATGARAVAPREPH